MAVECYYMNRDLQCDANGFHVTVKYFVVETTNGAVYVNAEEPVTIALTTEANLPTALKAAVLARAREVTGLGGTLTTIKGVVEK